MPLIGVLARDKNKNQGKKLLAVSQGPPIICSRPAAYLPYFIQPPPFVLTQNVLLAKLRRSASFIKGYFACLSGFFYSHTLF
jgi:hypothetical protein